MSRTTVAVFTLILILISFFVHELGHLIVGMITGLTPIGFGITPLSMYVVFDGTNFLMRLAGGLFQAAFLMLFTRQIPELWIGVIVFVVYGIVEGAGML